MTKQQILNNLALLPLSKLEKLEVYSKYLIIPEEDLLVNATMTQMVDKAYAVATQVFPEWTDRSPSDFGVFLVELFGLFSEKDFWYLNAFANQSIFKRISIYSIAFIRAIELGYRPKTTTGATAQFTFDFAGGSAITYDTGDLILELLDGTRFTNTSVINAPTSVAPFTFSTNLTQGTYTKGVFTFNGKQIDLRTPNIIIPTVELRIDGVLWQRVSIFGESGNSSTHYMVLPEEDGKCSIFFGEDGYGKRPNLNDSVEIKYVSTKGIDGNLPIQAVTVNKSLSVRPVATPVMDTVSSGGILNSPLEQLKNETLNYFNYRKAILNEDSAKTWLLDQPEVSKSAVTIVGNILFYNFRNSSGSTPTPTELLDVQNRMSPLVSNGYTISYAATTVVNASPINMDFYYLNGYDPIEMVSLGKQLVQDYTDSVVLCDYGKAFDLTELSLLLRSKIPGLQNVIFNIVAGLPASNITVPANRILDKVPLASITINTFVV